MQDPSFSHNRSLLGCFFGTLSPSFLQILSTRLWFTFHPLDLPPIVVPLVTSLPKSEEPLERAGEPDDVAKVVLFLVSGAADFITGELILVDGGHLLC